MYNCTTVQVQCAVGGLQMYNCTTVQVQCDVGGLQMYNCTTVQVQCAVGGLHPNTIHCATPSAGKRGWENIEDQIKCQHGARFGRAYWPLLQFFLAYGEFENCFIKFIILIDNFFLKLIFLKKIMHTGDTESLNVCGQQHQFQKL